MALVDDPNMVQWLIGQAGIGGLAGFALFMLRNAYQTALQREREYAESNREDKKLMMSVLGENTQALTKLTGMIEMSGRGLGKHDQ